METVYVETTVISYLAACPSRDILIAAHQKITNEWWNERRNHFECFVSQLVIDEAREGDPQAASARMKLIDKLPVLSASEIVEELTVDIINNGLLPVKAVYDAAHIAIAAVNRIDYLPTWNCKHLANAQLIRKLAVFINSREFNMPLICTPEELMGE